MDAARATTVRFTGISIPVARLAGVPLGIYVLRLFRASAPGRSELSAGGKVRAFKFELLVLLRSSTVVPLAVPVPVPVPLAVPGTTTTVR